MLGEKLIKLRKSKGLRQDEVFEKIGVARTTYAMYEQNRRQPDYDTLKKLASFYQVSTDYLLDFNNKCEDQIDLKDLIVHGKVTFDGIELTKEQRRTCIAFIETILELDKKDK